MKKKNKKKTAFTLIELLVTITILGVVTLMALPTVNKVKSDNLVKKYEAYGRSILIAGKLYNNTYDTDLFGKAESGCVDIPFDDLKAKKLIEDIKINRVTCNGDNLTKVRVRKASKKYKYELFMKCKMDSKEVYKTTNLNSTSTACTLNPYGDIVAPATKLSTKLTTSSGTVETNQTDIYLIEDKNKLNVTFTVTDTESGIAEGNFIHYIWKFNDSAITTSTKGVIEISPSDLGKGTVKLTVPNDIQTKNKKGTFKIEITPTKILDNANNQVPETNVITKIIKVDNTETEPPVSNLPKPTITCTQNGTTTAYTENTVIKGYVTCKANSNVSNIDHFTFKNETSNATSNGQTYTVPDHGTTVIKALVCTKDKCSDYSDTFTIKIDNKGPNTPTVSLYKWKDNNTTPTKPDNLDSYTNNTWYNGKVYTIASNSTDVGSANGVYYQYSVRGATTVSLTKGTSKNITNEGISYIKYRACDKLDNCSAYTSEYTIKLDRTAPSGPTVGLYKWKTTSEPTSTKGLESYTNNKWLKGRVYTVASGSKDTLSTVHYVYTTSGDTGSETKTGSTKSITKEGTSKIKYKACDEANNCSAYTSNYTIKLDRSAPTFVSKSQYESGSWNYFKLKFTDNGGVGLEGVNGSGSGKVYYCYDGTPQCNNLCKTGKKKIGNRHYETAIIKSNLDNTDTDTIKMRTSDGCGNGKYTVYTVVYVCDQLDNCAWSEDKKVYSFKFK